MIEKRIENAFGKKIYLLGMDKEKQNVWLEAPSWDCEWYWGFGYLERYTNNKYPQNAKDITSHTHFDSEITTKINGNYIHHINEHPEFIDTTLTDKQSWELSELMKTFYILSKTASLFYGGSAGVATNLIHYTLKNEKLYNYINKELLPVLFKQIDILLSPKE